MKAVLICVVLVVTACGIDAKQPNTEWKCIGGLTYEKLNGAWVQIDGHPLINFKDGPIKCVEDSPDAKEGQHD